MTETDKILDVTYGKFSCRLEGFDDSVEIMKAVVTFFHDLSGHDQFMNMAPQAPDLETLAELTSQQAGVPVDVTAQADTQKISLRVRRPVAQEETREDAARPSLRLHHPNTRAIFAEDADDHDADDKTDLADIVAEDEIKPQDMTAAPAEVAEDELTQEHAIEDTFTEEDFTEEDFSEDHVSEDADIADEVDEDTIAPAMEDTPEQNTLAAAMTSTDTSESVAAKLQRIRAVVGRSASSRIEDTVSEDPSDHPDTTSTPAANPLAQRLAELAQRNAALHTGDDSDADAFEDEEEDVLAAAMADRDDAYDDLDEEEVPLTAQELAEFEDYGSDYTNNYLAEEQPEPVAEAEADGQLDDDIEEEAHVETAAEDHADSSTDVEDDNDQDDDNTDDGDDLREQVAEVERTIAMRRESRSKRDELPENVDAAMSRILSQADLRLNEPEGRRHRDAFAQLKAAVAATEAARQLGDPGISERDPGEVFREDLNAHEAHEAHEADDADETTDNAKQAPAVAPLRLVPAQRVEDSEPAQSHPTDRLREIAAKKDAEAETPGGFAEFAAQKGATELADLLEAAAAYIAFVEGDDDFSRPQVMKKVQMASTDEISREDGLRSFGRLLRQSRIIKLNNGRFQVSEDTRFRPDNKAAQG